MFATTSSSSSRRAAAPYDEERVSPLVESLEAAVHRRCPVLPQSEVPASESLTYFHSKTLPRASVKTFVRAIVKARVGFTWTSVAIALSLVQRYRRVHGDASVTPHMLHRMMIACLLVGAKAVSDEIPTNRLIAKTVGISKIELYRIERLLCERLSWRVGVHHNDLLLDEADLSGRTVSLDADGRIASSGVSAASTSSSLRAPSSARPGGLSPASSFGMAPRSERSIDSTHKA
eukprot:CAMPEP_0174832246 /NCGR_PEP_ID=MMETSP1114-20130205/3569_1 /TAXON_ID=312471 /ORGANISM="Neobodo designis, Strain CCAP 1951/1" /LENGTH=232 /DNA_ID=CAMNT_0016066101 /DNA_START=64 /DNA_END=762 /DNA_ORIENTATION=-